ncbi:MAG: Gfo/Idh/MocA family oxidoreductase [Planctomycetota bacterium]
MKQQMHNMESSYSRRALLGRAGAGVLLAGTSGTLTSNLHAADAVTTPDSGTYKPLNPDKKVRVGVVGGGFGASFQWHLHPNCVVHAVSDLRADRRDHLMKVYKCGRSYESLEKLILDKDIDAVAVFTGVPDHARHCTAVMNTGKHVMCAVAACMSLEEAEQLRAVKERTGVKYMMAETSYYRQYTIAARDLYNQGAFGELFYSEVEYYHPVDEAFRKQYWSYDGKRTWRYGYPPMHYPTHSTGFLIGVTKERLTEVSCLGLLAPQGMDGYGVGKNQYDNPFNTGVALMKTDRGHICRCIKAGAGTNAGERAQWFGTDMSFFMPSYVSGQPFRMHGPQAPKWTELPDYMQRLPQSMRVKTGHGDSHTFLTHEFIAAIVEDREPAIDIYESLAMTVPGIIAHQSALKGGEQLKVPGFDRIKS